jgi:hypothetical protein
MIVRILATFAMTAYLAGCSAASGPESQFAGGTGSANSPAALRLQQRAGIVAPNATEYLSGYYVLVDSPNEITAVETTLRVPAEPPATGTLFEWPGLDPDDGPTYDPIENGVLQPVLTWGPSCAPGKQPANYSTWWISAQYVNTVGNDPGYTGCHGGPIMSVNVGDSLVERLTLTGQKWTDVVTDEQTGKSVSFTIDMRGQQQQILYFQSEGYGQNPVGAVVYTDTSFTFSAAPEYGCDLLMNGTEDSRDVYSKPTLTNNGLTCTIAKIVLYSPYKPVKP